MPFTASTLHPIYKLEAINGIPQVGHEGQSITFSWTTGHAVAQGHFPVEGAV